MMDWDKPFCVYRIVENGTLEPVFVTGDMKKAKYWLSYIAEYGDALCRTPAHPKNDGKKPLYWLHKEDDRSPVNDQSRWKELLDSKKCEEHYIVPPETLS